MTFIDWFYDLKRQLWERFTIKIEDFEKFTSVVNDFKKNGFDITKIMEKYISSISLDDKIKKESDELQILYNQKIELKKELPMWQDQVNQHQQTMNIYYQLKDMNLGFKDLKQLRYTILEIAEANNISPDKAVLKFLDDIEKEYDNNLGFEKKVKEKKDKLDLLSNKVVNCRTIIQSQSSIGPTLSNLLQKGMTEQDIININQIVDICTNNTDFSNSKSGPQKENRTKDKIKDTNNDNKIINKSEYRNLLINELQKYGNLKLAVKGQQGNLEKLQKEIIHLNGQKQEISIYLQIAISFINTINNEISYYKRWMDQFNKDQNIKINLSSRLVHPFIIIIYKNTGKDKDVYDNDET
jgi:hypothetical protein